MREGFIVILLAWYLKGVSTVRDYSVDRLSLEGPGEAQLVANPLPQVEEEAEAGNGSSLRIDGDIREGPDNGGAVTS
eukprot:symbB.v1.2.012206.t1/scaffold834.1/size159133/4